MYIAPKSTLSSKKNYCKKKVVCETPMIDLPLACNSKDSVTLKPHPVSLFENSENTLENCLNSSKIFTCKYCLKIYNSKTGLKIHHRTHTGERPFVCEICQKGFVRKYALVTHYDFHHKENKEKSCELAKESDRTMEQNISPLGKTTVDHSSYVTDQLSPELHNKFNRQVQNQTICSRNKTTVTRNTEITQSYKSNEASIEQQTIKSEPDLTDLIFKPRPKTDLHLQNVSCKDGSLIVNSQTSNENELSHETNTKDINKNVLKKNRQFVCDFCFKAFQSFTNYYVHKLTHIREKQFVCNICKKGFISKMHLRQHYNVHLKIIKVSDVLDKKPETVQNRPIFPYLKKFIVKPKSKTIQSGDLNRAKIDPQHKAVPFFGGITEKLQESEFIQSCDSNNANTDEQSNSTQPSDLEIQNASSKNENPEINCQTLSKSGLYGKIKEINVENIEPCEDKKFVCGTCDKAFKKSSTLQDHQLTHIGVKPFVCNICKWHFKNKTGLITHYRIHGVKPYFCDTCNIGFRYKAQLSSHNEKHLKGIRFVCDFCKQEFTNKYALKQHYRRHTMERPYSCDVCHKTFTQVSGLRNHKIVHFEIKKPFSCVICNKSFSKMKNLQDHKFLHTDNKPFVCDVCEKGFTRLESFKTHYRLHTGEKPFVCDICQESFFLKVQLHIHYSTHSKTGPHACNICQKSFTSEIQLRTHYRYHARSGAFVCSICEKGFSKRSHLLTHSYKHTIPKH